MDKEVPSPACEQRQYRWVILAFLMALCFISHFNRGSITSAGDEKIMVQNHISPAQMGIVYSSFLVVYTIFMIPGGWLIDRRGARFALAVMGFGSALFCIFTGAIGFGIVPAAQTFVALLIVRSLMGLLSAPLHPGAARAVGNWFPSRQQSLANGLITGAAILAYAVVHPIFGKLIDKFNWPLSFVITGAVTALLTAFWLIFGADNEAQRLDESQPKPAPLSTPMAALDLRNLVLITISYSAVGYFQYLFFYWVHYYFDSVLHMEKIESRFYSGLPNLAMAISMPLGGWLTDIAVRARGENSGRTLIPKIGMISSAIFLLFGIFATDRVLIVTCFTASLGLLGLCEASFWTVAVKIGHERGGSSAAIMNTGGNGVGLLAPVITPWLGSRLGWNWGIGLGAIVAVLGALCWFGLNLREATDPNSRGA